MPTQRYILKSGVQVPSATQIIGRFKESGALIGWAIKRTRELDLEILRTIPSNIFDLQSASLAITTARTPRDQARDEASAGTICHQWIDDYAHSRSLTEYPDLPDEMRRMADNGLQSFKRWWDLNQFKVISTETPLVSEAYQYGGTRDMLAEDKFGDLCMLDWKCANAVYPAEYVPQLAAYCQLARESGDGVVAHCHLFRAGKQDASGHEHQYSKETVAKGWELFRLYRKAYSISNSLKRL